ncbi:MAG: amino acid permease [Lactobacillaceae bacterium]|jgi:APA family basic amino acid/polyamine antiporter|nr:amino acid permease [Lactobacillaceae bacterium]
MEQNHLKKEIGIFGALSSIIGTVIGAGVFFKIASMAERTGSANLVIIAWILAAIFTIAGGLTIAELGTMFPQTGGGVKYLEHGYGKIWGFLFGWIQIIVYYPANIAALAIIWATQFTNLFQIKQGQNLIWIAILVFITILGINSLSAKFASNTHTLFTVLKLIPIFLIVIVGLFTKSEVHFQLFPLVAGKDINPFIGVGGAMVSAMFAFDGWIGIGNLAGELKKPKRDLPLALIVGLVTISIIYLLVSIVMLRFMPIEQIAGNKNTASQVASILFGQFGGKLVTIGILISVYGAINGYVLSAIRVPYALAIENSLPFSKTFSKLNRFASPQNAGLWIAFFTIILMLSNRFDALSDLAVFASWLFYILLFIEVIKLRKQKPELTRSYKTWGYPITPIIASIGGIFIVISYITNLDNIPFLIFGAIVLLIGIPIFKSLQKTRNK